MKSNCFKANCKRFLAGVFGVLLFISSNSIANAATSDEVTLSIAKPGAGYVNTESTSLIIREYPSTSANVLGSLPKDSMVMIVERGSDFYKVQYDAAGHYGYVSRRYIREYDLDYYCTANTTGTLNLRAGTGTSYAILASIPSQRNFPILLQISDWDYALYGNVDGYVSTQYIVKHHY